jgi:hypothetical protein
MALSWLTALKAVPWADVVQAAPGIVQGARKLFTAARGGDAATAAPGGAPEGSLAARIESIEAAIDVLQGEQRSSAELIRSLAEQNASIIAALDLLRSRVRLLTGACAGLAIALCVLALVVALR